MKKLRFFRNEHEKRPFAVWRLLLHLLLLIFALMALDGLSSPLALRWPALIEIGVGVLAFGLSVWLAGRWLDHRSWSDFGFHLSRRWAQQAVFGFLLGGILMGGIFLIEWSMGYARVTAVGYVVDPAQPLWQALLLSALSFFSVAFTEELLFRGYQLRNVAEGLNGRFASPSRALWLATLLTSIVFGMVHAGNTAATAVSILFLMGLGVLFAFGYLLTGELAIPLSLHLSWNFFQGNVFGFPVSGWPVDGGSVLQISQNGPVWLTGGDFGPEAGVLGLLAMGLGCLFIWLFVRWEEKTAVVQVRLAQYNSNTTA